MRILIVDDHSANRVLLQRLLSRYGDCDIAANGREAVEAFQSAARDGSRYNLICMDIMMPEVDGHEAVRQIRAIEDQQGVPPDWGVRIIMTTALDDLENVKQAFQALCDAYLVKPIQAHDLIDQLRGFGLVA